MLKRIFLATMLCLCMCPEMVFAVTGLKITNDTDKNLTLYITAAHRCAAQVSSNLLVPPHDSRTISLMEFQSICPTIGFCIFDIYLSSDCTGRKLAVADLQYLNPFHFSFFDLLDKNYAVTRTESEGRPTLLKIYPST